MKAGVIIMKLLLWSIVVLATIFTTSTGNKRVSRHHRGRTEFLHSRNNAPSTENSSPSAISVCDGWWCGHGRECTPRATDGLPECICIRECPLRPHGKSVCGSDGHLYSSHCELHRAACLFGKSQKLTVDHSASCKSSHHNHKMTPPQHQSEDEVLDPNGISEADMRVSGEDGNVGTSTLRRFDSEEKSGIPLGQQNAERTGTVESESGDAAAAPSLNPDSDLEIDEHSNKVSPSVSSSLCTPQEYEIFKDNLLLYNHEMMIGTGHSLKEALEKENVESVWRDPALGDGPEANKDYLLSLMFSHFDRNNNEALEYNELHKIDADGKMEKLTGTCKLTDFLFFDDLNHDGLLHINEFYMAFSKLYSVTMISLDKALEVVSKTVTVGETIEIQCDVTGSPPAPVVWKRFGVDLSTLLQEDEIRVNIDGTLALSNVQMFHAGNYSCQAQRNQEVIQTHVITVQSPPDVSVRPHIVWEQPGKEVVLECRVFGEPLPQVEWLRNDEPLPTELPDKYTVSEGGTKLTLRDIYYSDTGAYMCRAGNSGGKRVDVASLVVINQPRSSSEPSNESQLLVFHGNGLSSYDPQNCRLLGQILAEDLIPRTQGEALCGKQFEGCSWGRTIRVSSSVVYATQPNLDRILIISVSQNSMAITDVVTTDRYPVELHYVPHLDQVWVECWGEESDGTQKTLQVIRNAKEKAKHSSVHPDPINSHFDLVQNIFLPPDLRSTSQFRYAYVSHANVRKLYKLDLITLRYVKSVDLTPFNCVPRNLQFSSLYGFIFLQCFEPVTNHPTGRVTMDSLTDSVISVEKTQMGQPYLSPDSRKLVTAVPEVEGTTLVIQLIRESGVIPAFNVTTFINVSDLAYIPSEEDQTYNIIIASNTTNDIFFVDLDTGIMEGIAEVGFPPTERYWRSPMRPLVHQGDFNKFVVTPSADSVVVINARKRELHCEIEDLSKPQFMVLV